MRIAIRWGVALGVAICVWTMALHVLGFYTVRLAAGQIADVAAAVLPLAVIVLALRERRRSVGRGLRLVESAQTGLVIGIVSGPISAAFLWWYHHRVNPRWLDLLVEWKTETMRAAGATAADIAMAADALRAGGTDQAQIIGGLLGSVMFSLAMAMLAHLYFRRAVG